MSAIELSPWVVDALESQRDSLNQRFRNRQKSGIKIDPEEFQEHIWRHVGPIADAVHEFLPERTRITVSSIVDVSLDLFASNQLGRESRLRWMNELWEQVLPKAAKLIARDPSRSVGCLANGLIHIENQSQESAGRWLELIERTIALCNQTDEWLVAGKIAAWLSGMVQYRQEAIAIARTVRPAIVRALLALPDSITDSDIDAQLVGFSSNPWHKFLTDHTNDATPIERVRVCCRFRGFGGTLMAPPHAAMVKGHLMVTDGRHVWHLISDRYGWMLQRNEMEPATVMKLVRRTGKSEQAHEVPFLKKGGTIVWNRHSKLDPELAQHTSVSFDGRTLAVTTPTSFHVFLYSRTEDVKNASLGLDG